MKLNAQQLRNLPDDEEKPILQRKPLSLILDNVYDTYNIGGLFRLADALAMEKIYLCGATETPPNHKIKKASIGAYKIVPWEYQKTATGAIRALRERSLPAREAGPPDGRQEQLAPITSGLTTIAIEQHPHALPYHIYDYKLPLALVVGNETTGISTDVLSLCDEIVEIPMYGINKSLNVIVSAAIVGYHISLYCNP